MQKTTKKADEEPSGFPCWHCAVRPDVACQHRPAHHSWQLPPVVKDEDGRKRENGGGVDNGHNFKGAKVGNISGGGGYAAHKLKRLKQIVKGR